MDNISSFGDAADATASALVGVVASLGLIGISVAAAFVGYRVVKKILSKLA